MAKKHDYLGLDYTLSLILAIIPPTCLVMGIITRIKEGHYLAAILRIIVGWNIIWIVDLVFMILNRKIFRLL